MSGRLATIGAITGLLLASVGGVFVGMRLAERVNEPATQVLAVEDPESAPASDVARRSPAGFTGFEQDALGGRVTRAGATSEANAGAFEVREGPASMIVRTTTTTRLYRIAAAERPLAPGDVIVVRLDESGAPLAVLRVPPDLREGDAR